MISFERLKENSMNNERYKRLITTIALLQVPGIGRGRFNKLVATFGSAEKVATAPFSALAETTSISRTLASNIKTHYNPEEAEKIALRINRLGWAVLFPDDEEYPHLLARIPHPPPLIVRIGRPAQPSDKMIAIVGTRHPSEKGKQFTYDLAKSLAKAGIVVVSGMAEGIDSAAHAGALDADGQTVAVWGNSLDQVYPSVNRKLAERIKASGSVYSEYLPGTFPDKATFPERNRIISGLSEGTIVIEAGRKSGALITARHALEQSREVFAVPGATWAGTSIGPNELIKSGATMLTTIDDIFQELPRLKGVITSKKFYKLPDITDVEKQIISQFSSAPMQIDQISRAVELPVEELTQFLLALELKGVVRELSGKRFVLADEFTC